jgi:hypothetical protein
LEAALDRAALATARQSATSLLIVAAVHRRRVPTAIVRPHFTC